MLQTYLSSPDAAPALAEGFAASVGAPVSADLARARAGLAAAAAALAAAIEDEKAADAALDAAAGGEPDSVLRRLVRPIVEHMVADMEQQVVVDEVRNTSADALRSEIERARAGLEIVLDDGVDVGAVIEAARAEAAVQILRQDVQGWREAILDAEDAWAEHLEGLEEQMADA